MPETKTGITADEIKRILARLGMKKVPMSVEVFNFCTEIRNLDNQIKDLNTRLADPLKFESPKES